MSRNIHYANQLNQLIQECYQTSHPDNLDTIIARLRPYFAEDQFAQCKRQELKRVLMLVMICAVLFIFSAIWLMGLITFILFLVFSTVITLRVVYRYLPLSELDIRSISKKLYSQRLFLNGTLKLSNDIDVALLSNYLGDQYPKPIFQYRIAQHPLNPIYVRYKTFAGYKDDQGRSVYLDHYVMLIKGYHFPEVNLLPNNVVMKLEDTYFNHHHRDSVSSVVNQHFRLCGNLSAVELAQAFPPKVITTIERNIAHLPQRILFSNYLDYGVIRMPNIIPLQPRYTLEQFDVFISELTQPNFVEFNAVMALAQSIGRQRD